MKPVQPDFQRELQTPGLAAADPSASVRAIELRGKMLEGVIGLAGEGYKQYRNYELEKIRQEAEELPREALRRGEEAQQAQKTLSLFSPIVAGQQDIVRQTEEQLAAEGLSPTQQKERLAAIGELSNYVSTAERLKAASEQGMSPSEYTMRVRSLTKKAIEKFPGLAPEIRQQIGRTTGLEYADDFAARSYVERMFSPKTEKATDATSRKRDFEVINKNLALPMQDIEAAYGTPEYDAMLRKGYEIQQLEEATRRAKLETESLSAKGGPAAIQAIQAFGFSAAAQSTIDFAKYQQQNAELFNRLATKVNSGELDNIDKTHTELQIISQQASSIISKNFRNAEQELDQKRALGTLNKEDYETAKTLLGNQKTRALEQFAPANMTQVAKILVAHKDKTLSDQQKILGAYMEFLKLLGPTELIASWYGSAEDSDTRRTMKKNYPPLAAALEKFDPLLKAAGQSIMQFETSAAKIEIARTLSESKATPTPTPVNTATPIPGVTEEVKKASLQAVAAEGDMVLKKLQKNPTQGITTQDANLIGTILNNGVEYNQPVETIRNNYESVANIFKRFTPEDQNNVKAAVSSTINQNSNKVIGSTESINNMFGTKLQIGVRSDGTIGVVPPMNLVESIAKQPVAARRADFGVFQKYEELKYRNVIPGKEEEFRKYAEAAKLWESTQRARTNNMVLSKAIVTGESPSKIGAEIAGLLEAKREVPMFYSAIPVVPVAPAPEQTGGTLGGPQPTVGPLKTEKAALSAMGVGQQDIVDTIAGLKRTLEDTKPGSPTFDRITKDIAMAEAELARMKKAAK